MEEDDRQRDDSSRKNEIDVRLHSAGRGSGVTLHYMPFLIDYEGEAPIQNYFVVESERVKLEEEGSTSALSTSTTSSSSSSASAAAEDDILRASFRGRLLRGKTLPLPSDYQGLVLQEATGRGADGEKQWHVSGQFSEWTYWNHDTRPHPSDLPQQWMGWLHLSQQVHQQVTEEEIAALSS